MEDQNELSFYKFDSDVSESEIKRLREEWQKHIRKRNLFLGQTKGSGRGIVITAGGIKYFTSSWILINLLRNLGCNLPIEVWFHGNEITKNMQLKLSHCDVLCRDLSEYIDETPRGFLMKPLAIIYSSFKEILFLDADNICVKDPSYLFEDEKYKKYGCIFWPDFWETPNSNPIWKILNIDYFKSREQESGQLLINKEKCWKQLQLCLYFNIKCDDYYKFMYGDKDTFRFAWLALKKEYFMISQDVGVCGYYNIESGQFFGTTMVQHDTQNKILFLHRNLLKWDVTLQNEKVWKTIKVFQPNAKNRFCRLGKTPYGYSAIDISGNIEVLDFETLFPNFEDECLAILHKLRYSRFYTEELHQDYIMNNRFFKT
jgi:alpha 1,2-mannosyltransferase